MSNFKHPYFADNLRDIRWILGFSQEEIAEKLGVKLSLYSLWEIGESEPSLCEIGKIIEIFNAQSKKNKVDYNLLLFERVNFSIANKKLQKELKELF